MLRPPPPTPQSAAGPPLYGNPLGSVAPPSHPARQSMPHYYNGALGSVVSPRHPVTSPISGSTSNPLDGGRVLAQKRRLQQQQSSEYTAASPPSLLAPPSPHLQSPSQSQSQQQPVHPSGSTTARTIYESSQHRPSSDSSSSTVRSSGGLAGLGLVPNHHHHHGSSLHPSALDDDDDDDNEDPLRFETRGSHGPRDEARYETWTSKQLRKKCSHLKLRGLKNVKKHVMVEALYRYYRNQRAKTGGSENGGGGATPTSGNGTHARSPQHNIIPHRPTHGRAASSMRSEDNAVYEDRYIQQQQGYEHAMTTSNGSSSYFTNANALGMRGGRPAIGSNNPTPSLNTNLLMQARRASPTSTSLTPPSASARLPLRHTTSNGALPIKNSYDLEESKYNALDNEVRITSEDVIRLVDVILSPEFVDRLSTELSRWQFWVDVREKYISLASTNGPSSYGAARGLTALGGDQQGPPHDRSGGSNSNNTSVLPLASSYMRPSAKWSSMQLWEMWKELTFAYTKTCFEFTAAGMRSVDERNYIQFCDGRPDVFYLHQRLHARPDLLHLIKSNEYIEEKCSSDAASEHTSMNAEKNAANALMGVSSPVAQTRPHKRFKRIVPAGTNGGGRQNASGSVVGGGASGGTGKKSGMAVASGAASGGNVGASTNTSDSDNATPPQLPTGKNSGRPTGSSSGSGNGGGGGGGGGPAQYLAANGIRVGTANLPNVRQEEGSTENSETTGEEGSLEKSNSNAPSSSDSARREALSEQKYFGLLLQNFEAIFESLHNKKVLLAALRKDNTAPDHLIADLHDDIHVLSALKKDFRNKLRQALE